MVETIEERLEKAINHHKSKYEQLSDRPDAGLEREVQKRMTETLVYVKTGERPDLE